VKKGWNARKLYSIQEVEKWLKSAIFLQTADKGTEHEKAKKHNI